MILSPDCDQFACVRRLGEIHFFGLNIISVSRITFVPRELFNMVQLQVIYFKPHTKKNVSILNLVPTTIRKNLRNVNYTSMVSYYTKRYTDMLIWYLKGGLFRVYRNGLS